MAVKIRLTRMGGKNNACYRVVACDSRSPRDGRFIEILGWYDPTRETDNYKLKLDRIEAWVGKGAQVSDTVASMVRQARRSAPTIVEPVELVSDIKDEVAEVPVVDAPEVAPPVAEETEPAAEETEPAAEETEPAEKVEAPVA